MAGRGVGVKVLFVDDEEYILLALKRLVSEEDFETLTAGSGEEALEILRTTKDIGLIVSDQRMPELCGADFLAQAKGIAPDALQIMLTGHADMATPVKLINNGGVYRFIAKPWDDDALLRTIREGIEIYCDSRLRQFQDNEHKAAVDKQLEKLDCLNDEFAAILEEFSHN